MIPARLCIEEAVTPGQALARGVALWQSTTHAEPVSLYAGILRGEALVLGAHQRAQSALSEAARSGTLELLRRRSGGVTLGLRDGITYLALGLHDRSALMPCPKLRVLNRNVRGALAGLRLAGVAAHYFGRDFVSVDSRPGVYVGWDADEGGRVLVEFFVAERASYLPPPAASGYPARQADPLRDKEVITLAQTQVNARGRELAQKLAQGYSAGFEVEWHEQPALPQADATTSALRVDLASEAADGLSWSGPFEEAIGFVEAGVTLDASGKLQRVRLAGDFFRDRGAEAALERALVGATPRERAIGQGIDAVFAHSPHELEGVRDLNTLREAILTAAARVKT